MHVNFLLNSDPEFALAVDRITIIDPYKYNNAQWMTYYHELTNDKDFRMEFSNTTIVANNRKYYILFNNDLISYNKDDIELIFINMIGSQPLLRYQYWTEVRKLV